MKKKAYTGLGRGSNPNSHRNKPKKEGATKLTLNVTPGVKKMLALVGDGNMSKGAEILERRFKVLSAEFDTDHLTYAQKHYYLLLELEAAIKLGNFDRVKELLPLIEECVEHLEGWKIETDWKEVIDESVVKIKGNWII